jgi:TPR repeat protein
MARLDVQSLDFVGSAAQAAMRDEWFELGLKYCSGRGVALDLVEAHKWFNLAATRGNDEARRYRTEIARELSRAEISDAQRRARAWLGRA